MWGISKNNPMKIIVSDFACFISHLFFIVIYRKFSSFEWFQVFSINLEKIRQGEREGKIDCAHFIYLKDCFIIFKIKNFRENKVVQIFETSWLSDIAFWHFGHLPKFGIGDLDVKWNIFINKKSDLRVEKEKKKAVVKHK